MTIGRFEDDFLAASVDAPYTPCAKCGQEVVSAADAIRATADITDPDAQRRVLELIVMALKPKTVHHAFANAVNIKDWAGTEEEDFGICSDCGQEISTNDHPGFYGTAIKMTSELIKEIVDAEINQDAEHWHWGYDVANVRRVLAQREETDGWNPPGEEMIEFIAGVLDRIAGELRTVSVPFRQATG